LCLSGEAQGAETRQLAEGASSPPATLADFAWMAGRWTGDGLGGQLEEVYSPPAAGVMLGHFMARDQDGAGFYELITLREEKGSVMLRLRHFDPDLKAWEDKGVTVEFPLVEIAGNRFYFNGLTIEKVGPDETRHHILLRAADGSLREQTTHYLRAPPQDPGEALAQPPPTRTVDCRDADHRALDFWVGDWVVYDTKSVSRIGTSRIELLLNGCAIKETYEQTIGPAGQALNYRGTSYSALNNADRKWRQLYVDSGGAALSYSGEVEGGAMVLRAAAGAMGTRMSLRPQSDGSVRQIGEITRDGGATWSPGVDLTYRRR
jgi:hypothetical protein